MEEPIQEPSNIVIPFSKKTLMLIILLVVAALALVLILPSLFSPAGQPDSNQPAAPNAPQPTYPASAVSSTVSSMQPSGFSVIDNSIKGNIYFSNGGKRVAVNKTIKVRIFSNQNELFSKMINLREQDFNFNEFTTTRTSTEKGYQEIIEETQLDVFYELTIPLSEVKKDIQSTATISIELTPQTKEIKPWEGSLTDLPRDPTKFTGNPDLLGGLVALVSDSRGQLSYSWMGNLTGNSLIEPIYFKVFFSLSEKGILVSSPGTLEITAENSEGKTILTKTSSVTPSDFSFEAIKSSIYSQSPNKQLKYVFEFSSDEIPEGECVSKISVSFTAPNSQPLQGSTSSRSYCAINCSLSDLCPKT